VAICQGWGLQESPRSALCLSPGMCPTGYTALERSSWLYAPRAGVAPFVLLRKHNEEVRAAVLKAVQRGFGCSLLIENWWENRCQNPGFDIIYLPTPNKRERES